MHDRLPLPQPDLDWSLTGPRPVKESPRPGREGYWEREKFFNLPRPVLDRTTQTGRPVPQPVDRFGHSLDRLSVFCPEKPIFLFLSFLTLRQGL